MATSRPSTIAIIGGGPIGLAAAAHALKRGMRPLVLEAGPQAGHAVRQWGHVRMFSPWEYNIDAASVELLAGIGWRSPEQSAYPTGGDFVARYIEPLATRTALKELIRTNAEIIAISRVGFDRLKTQGREAASFEIRYRSDAGLHTVRADSVIDASGTWRSPNPAGSNGLDAIGEAEQAARLAYAMPDVLGLDRARYAGKRVAVLGAGHSAIGTLIDLARLKDECSDTSIVWLLRGDRPEKAFGGGANDKLAARGELGSAFARLVREQRLQVETGFYVSHLSDQDGRLRIGAGSSCCGRHVIADELIVATGFRPDRSFLAELRVSLDPALECPSALAPLIDPNEHSCGTVRPHGARELSQPEPGFYFAGAKSYGRAPTFLLLTGYEQVRSIVAEIAGDHEAAARVELVLPETGVCSRSPLENQAAGCCGGPPEADASACCAADEVAKIEGKPGCGCSPATAKPQNTQGCCG